MFILGNNSDKSKKSEILAKTLLVLFISDSLL